MPRIALAILGHRPDVVVLTEWRRTTGGQIAGVLADHGLKHQVCTDPPHGRNGVLVASRTRMDGADGRRARWFGSFRREGPTAQRLTEVDFPDLGLGLAAVHIPPDGDRTRDRVFETVVASARRRREQGFVVMGDFNSGRHHLDEAGATFSCTRLLGTLAAYGYVDAWRCLNPRGREYTWFSHEGGGFRIDHCFLSGTLAPRLSACWHSHKEREEGLSDHSMLVVCLDAEGEKPRKSQKK
jgi:exonuclease III